MATPGSAREVERHDAAAPRTGSQGPDEAAKAIGLKPMLSGVKTEDEGLFVVQHKLLAADACSAPLRGAKPRQAAGVEHE